MSSAALDLDLDLVVRYYWRKDPADKDLRSWFAGATEWQHGTLGDLRTRLAADCGSAAELAAPHMPRLVREDGSDAKTDADEALAGMRLLVWRRGDEEARRRLAHDFVLFTFPSKPALELEPPLEALVAKAEGFLDRQLSRDERNLFATPAFSNFRALLRTDTFSSRHVTSLLVALKRNMSTSTRLKITLENEGISLNGPVTSFGQSGVEVLYAFDGPLVLCAKVATRAWREYDVSEEIHRFRICPTVVQILKKLTIPPSGKWDANQQGFVMPLFPRNVTQAQLAMQLDDVSSRERLAYAVAICGLATIHAFKLAGYAHGDIKPSNMMLSCDRSGVITTVDFGAAARVGEMLQESSKYGLDEERQAGEVYDLVCLGTSILEILQPAFKIEQLSKADALQVLSELKASLQSPSPVLSAAESCLKGKDAGEAIAQILVAQMKNKDRSPVPTMESVWPKDRN